MNIIPTAYSDLVFSRPVSPHRSDRPPVDRDISPPIMEVEEAIEESLIKLRSNPSYGLAGLIVKYDRREEHNGLMYEITLSIGSQIVLLFGNSRRKLRRLARHVKAKYKRHAQSIIVRIGESMAHLRTRIANSIREVVHVMTHPDDPDADHARQRKCEQRARWIVKKNFQPHFA